MSESTRTSRAPAEKRLTYQQWKRRKMLRLARNWVLFLTGCAAVVALLTGGILWLLPKAHALIAGPVPFAARAYSADGYVCDTDDARLVVVNANLPLESEPAPELAVADDLYRTASGNVKGAQKIPLENYILQYYFRRVILEANRRLDRMSDGRFSLCQKQEEGLSGKAGLALDVLDRHTGKVRDVGTLSGGESFLA